jgi:hypothetical protein
MRGRILVGVSIAGALLSLSLAGCTSQPTTASCSPLTAKISWGKGKRAGSDATLGVHVVTYSQDASIKEDDPKSVEVRPTFSGAAISQLIRNSSTSRSTWQDALLASARKIPSVGAEFAAHVPLGSDPVAIDHPIDGTYVIEVGENQFRLPFTVRCTGHAPVTGTVTGALTGGTASFALQCGHPLTAEEKKTPGAFLALSYCPKP